MQSSRSAVIDIFMQVIFLVIIVVYGIDYELTYKYETVSVIVKDVIVEPSTIMDDYYVPEKYYLAVEDDNNQYVWTIQGKEEYDRYKDMVGETIEAEVKVYSKNNKVLCKLEGKAVTGQQVSKWYYGSPSRSE